jgi:uncharacterized protein YxeA
MNTTLKILIILLIVFFGLYVCRIKHQEPFNTYVMQTVRPHTRRLRIQRENMGNNFIKSYDRFKINMGF